LPRTSGSGGGVGGEGGGQTGFSTGGHTRGGDGVAAGVAGAAGVGAGGADTQAATSATAARPSTARAWDDNANRLIRSRGKAVGWILFEVLVALAIAVAIVWWTFPRDRRDREPPQDGPPR
jgi:hypothetical protein